MHMLLLSAPFDHARPAAQPFPWRGALEAALAAASMMAVGFGLGRWGGWAASWAMPVMGAAVHAGLLALGWVAIKDGQGAWRGAALRTATAVVAASLLSRLGPWGAIAYGLLPAVVIAERRRDRALVAAGVVWPMRRFALVGTAAGALLGRGA